jgi:hypothetical protein
MHHDGRCGYFEDDVVVSVVSTDLDSLLEPLWPLTLTADFSGLKPCPLPLRDMWDLLPCPVLCGFHISHDAGRPDFER